MKPKEIKLYAGHNVMKSKLSNQSKIQLLKFIKEATLPQVMVLIMDGKVAQLDKQSEHIAKDRFKATMNRS